MGLACWPAVLLPCRIWGSSLALLRGKTMGVSVEGHWGLQREEEQEGGTALAPQKQERSSEWGWGWARLGVPGAELRAAQRGSLNQGRRE